MYIGFGGVITGHLLLLCVIFHVPTVEEEIKNANDLGIVLEDLSNVTLTLKCEKTKLSWCIHKFYKFEHFKEIL